MRYEMIGSSKIKSSKIIMGTWQADKEMWAGMDDREIIKAIHGAVDLGVNTFDTAIVYGDDHSEAIVAAALKTVPREQYYIAAKAFDDKLSYQQILNRCEQSLKNLRTDYIDLYQICFPSDTFNQLNGSGSIREAMEALNTLQDAGKILNIGIANFSKEQIAEALNYGEIASHQPRYFSNWQPYDKSTNYICRNNNIATLIYAPLVHSLSSEKVEVGPIIKSSAHRSCKQFTQELDSFYVQEVLLGLQKYAEKYNASFANIVLNWIISKPLSFAIIDASDLNDVRKKIRSCNFILSEQELAELDELSAQFTKNALQSKVMLDIAS